MVAGSFFVQKNKNNNNICKIKLLYGKIYKIGDVIMEKNEIFLITRIVISVIILIIASITDLKTKKIPKSLTLSAISIGLIFRTVELILGIIDWKYYLFGFLGVIAVFVIVGFPKKPIMGGGDAKLLMALFLIEHPLKILVTFLLANVVVGAVFIIKYIVIVKFVVKNKLKGEKTESFGSIPMAPGFAISYILLTMYHLIKLYM